jgi:DNA-binding beta-propeller fold protein YncE
MRSRFRPLWLFVCTAALLLLAMGCNDTLRQFITPVPSPTGDPGALAHAIIVSTNPLSSLASPAPGSDMHIDVSGDSAVGVVPLGINPVFLGKTSNRVFAINQGDANTPPTVSIYTALLPQAATVTTATLPTSALKPIAGSTSSSGNIFIANRGSNDISVISGSVLAVTVPSIPVGTEPVMIAGNAANNKIFVVNHNNGGTGSVTEISTIDNTILKPSIPVGTAPIWAVMSSDGLFVFVVNQGDGTVTVIDASTDDVMTCNPGPACPASGKVIFPIGKTPSPSPNFAFYDSKLKRVYVSNTGENTISVIRADNISANNPPTKLKDIDVAGTPTSVTALSDGSKAYAALGNCVPTPSFPVVNHTTIIDLLPQCIGNLVSVIDASSLQQTGTITVGPGAVSIDASLDASKVYVISANDITTIRDDVHAPNCTDNSCVTGPVQPDRTFATPSVSVIRTSTNTVLATPVNAGIVSSPLPTFHLPSQDPKCVAAIDPNFNDDVPLPCPVQSPFMVRTFP